MMMDYKKVEKIFKAFNSKIIKVTPVNTLGSFLLKVKTDKGNYFLKVYSKKESKTGYKLAHLYPFLLKKNLPVPKVLKYDGGLNMVTKPYLIMSEIEGEPLYNSIKKMSEQDKLSFYYHFGKIVAKIHSITFDKFGETLNGKKVVGFSFPKKST